METKLSKRQCVACWRARACVCVFVSRAPRKISNDDQIQLHHFIIKEPSVRVCPRSRRAIRFISGEKEERMEGAEEGGGVRRKKRDVCYILSNLSSCCWGLIAAAKDKWIISCCFHLYTIYCQIAQSHKKMWDFILFIYLNYWKKNQSWNFSQMIK